MDSDQVDPSWGPVGKLLEKRMNAPDLAQLMILHADMLALERGRRAAAEPAALPVARAPKATVTRQQNPPPVWQRGS